MNDTETHEDGIDIHTRAEKRLRFLSALNHGIVSLHCYPAAPVEGIDLPYADRLVRLDCPPLDSIRADDREVSDWGIKETVKFNGLYRLVKAPWDCIYACSVEAESLLVFTDSKIPGLSIRINTLEVVQLPSGLPISPPMRGLEVGPRLVEDAQGEIEPLPDNRPRTPFRPRIIREGGES